MPEDDMGTRGAEFRHVEPRHEAFRLRARRPRVRQVDPVATVAIAHARQGVDRVPPSLDAVIDKAIEKDPHRRYQSAAELLQDLKRVGAPEIRDDASTRLPVDARMPSSIVVLPFADMSPQKDQEYFCHGLTEEIINTLTTVSGLRVISRTSAFAFQGKDL